MKKPRHDEAYLDDIRKAAEQIAAFCHGITREQFEIDVMRQFAILHQLMVIGEAAKKISSAFRNSHPNIEWKKMAGMRDILVHAYHELDLDVIWKTIQNDLPTLLIHLSS